MSENALWSGAPRWYLWDGGFFALGRSDGMVPAHSHHAIQVVISLDREVRVAREEGEWQAGRGLVVMPDVVHRYHANGSNGSMLFIDPESIEGAWLRTTLPDDITLIPEERIERAAAEVRLFIERPLEAMELRPLIRYYIAQLCAGAPPSRRLDERVTSVLRKIAGSEDLRVSLDDVAASVHLSPSRFQHLFKQQVGLPFRRYLLWRKLTRAMLSIGRERTLTAAAQASDFADAAHLTRTFQQMFGLAPSVLMRGEFFVIESPFG